MSARRGTVILTPALRSILLALLLFPSVSRLQAASVRRMAPDTSALEFHGFRAGARLAELTARVRELRGGRLRCDRAKADPRVTECRGVIRDTTLGDRVQVWVSAIDSVAGVITLSSPVAAEQLDRWRSAVERRYGRVSASAQGSQWMMQWVRRGRMLRLTWRLDRGRKTVSLSLVDGLVLDAWGRSRSAPDGN